MRACQAQARLRAASGSASSSCAYFFRDTAARPHPPKKKSALHPSRRASSRLDARARPRKEDSSGAFCKTRIKVRSDARPERKYFVQEMTTSPRRNQAGTVRAEEVRRAVHPRGVPRERATGRHAEPPLRLQLHGRRGEQPREDERLGTAAFVWVTRLRESAELALESGQAVIQLHPELLACIDEG